RLNMGGTSPKRCAEPALSVSPENLHGGGCADVVHNPRCEARVGNGLESNIHTTFTDRSCLIPPENEPSAFLNRRLCEAPSRVCPRHTTLQSCSTWCC